MAIWPVTGHGFENYMTGSAVFSINFINRLIPAKLKYLMSIENSQAILKYFIDLKSETSVNQTRLEIYKAFQDRLTILNRLLKFIENTGLPVM